MNGWKRNCFTQSNQKSNKLWRNNQIRYCDCLALSRSDWGREQCSHCLFIHIPIWERLFGKRMSFVATTTATTNSYHSTAKWIISTIKYSHGSNFYLVWMLCACSIIIIVFHCTVWCELFHPNTISSVCCEFRLDIIAIGIVLIHQAIDEHNHTMSMPIPIIYSKFFLLPLSSLS